MCELWRSDGIRPVAGSRGVETVAHSRDSPASDLAERTGEGNGVSSSSSDPLLLELALAPACADSGNIEAIVSRKAALSSDMMMRDEG